MSKKKSTPKVNDSTEIIGKKPSEARSIDDLKLKEEACKEIILFIKPENRIKYKDYGIIFGRLISLDYVNRYFYKGMELEKYKDQIIELLNLYEENYSKKEKSSLSLEMIDKALDQLNEFMNAESEENTLEEYKNIKTILEQLKIGLK